MHEVLKYLVRDDCRLLYKPTEEVDHKQIQHVSFIVDSSWEAPPWLHYVVQLKSLLFILGKSS